MDVMTREGVFTDDKGDRRIIWTAPIGKIILEKWKG